MRTGGGKRGGRPSLVGGNKIAREKETPQSKKEQDVSGGVLKPQLTGSSQHPGHLYLASDHPPPPHYL